MEGNCLGDWNVHLVYASLGYAYHNVTTEGLIEITLGQALVILYKTTSSVGVNWLASSKVEEHLVVSKTGFSEDVTRGIEQVVHSCLKTCNSEVNTFTEQVTTELMSTYGGIWQCFTYKANFGFYCVRSDKGRFALFTGVKVLIFQ